MWCLSARKNRRTPSARIERNTFRPRLEALEDRCLLSAGALDIATFGGPLAGSNSPAGTVLGPSGINQFNPTSALVVYPNTGSNPTTDNKIVVGGWLNGKTRQTTSSFALVRYNANGSLDTAFGTQGVVSTAIGNSAAIYGLALQSDGKIVAVGSAGDRFVVARYVGSGQLDSTFGTSGSGYSLTRAVLPGSSSNSERAYAVAIQGEGASEKIYACGATQFSIGTGKNATSGWDMALVRYNANGSLDTAFSSGGIAITPNFGPGGVNVAYALAIQPDGKVVLAGATHPGSPGAMATVRYTTAGTLDSHFGSGGIATLTANSTEAGAFGVFVQNSGAIVLSGYSYVGSSEKQTLARLTPSGALDTTFGNSGFVINPYMVNGHSIVQAANGDLLTAGTVGTSTYNVSDDFGVAAFLPDGAPDTTFGPNGTGTSTAPITNGADMGQALALQSDGKIVVGGFSYDAASIYSVALARFLAPSNTFTASPNAVAAGASVTLYASNITDPNLTGSLTQVAFYRDSNGNGTLEVGTDALLGTAVTNTDGTWSITFSTTGLAPGTYTLFAQASDGVNFSVPLAISFTVL